MINYNKGYINGYNKACSTIKAGYGYGLFNMRYNNTNNNRRVLRVNRNRVITRNAAPARFYNNPRRNGIEINRAEGGFKRMLPNRKTVQIAINRYFNLEAVKQSDNSYIYGFNAPFTSFSVRKNLTAFIDNEEFNDYLAISDQYKVFGINVNIDINRIPQAGDVLPKLLLYYDTDNYVTEYPLTASNVMHLSVTQTGNKNYNVRFNKANINKDYIGWRNSQDAYNTKIELCATSASQAFISGNPDYVRLGTIKVTYNVKFRLRDRKLNVTKKDKVEDKKDIKEDDLSKSFEEVNSSLNKCNNVLYKLKNKLKNKKDEKMEDLQKKYDDLRDKFVIIMRKVKNIKRRFKVKDQKSIDKQKNFVIKQHFKKLNKVDKKDLEDSKIDNKIDDNKLEDSKIDKSDDNNGLNQSSILRFVTQVNKDYDDYKELKKIDKDVKDDNMKKKNKKKKKNNGLDIEKREEEEEEEEEDLSMFSEI